MDAETVRWLLTGAMGLVMYFFKRSQDEMNAKMLVFEAAIQNLRDTRVHKDDLKEFKAELREQFDEVKQAIKDLKNNA